MPWMSAPRESPGATNARRLSAWSHLPSAFKLIVTSRDKPDPSLFHSYKHIELQSGHFSNIKARNDIQCFLRARFAHLLARPLLSNWPGQAKFDQLAALAAGIFIWAETVIHFVDYKSDSPDDRLDLVLAELDGEGPGDINALYRRILQVSFAEADSRNLDSFRVIVGTIILAKVPLCRDDLRFFLNKPISESMIDQVLHNLSSVIMIVGIDKVLHVRHISFTEFMCDPNQCPARFTIDSATHNCHLVSACLRLMKEGFKDNICDLWVSHPNDRNVPDMTGGIQTSITLHLSYSCRFWAEHLRDIPNVSPFPGHLSNKIKDFFDTHLLHWVQVMAFIKEVPAASAALRYSAEWTRVS
jgi:hypothetical protein